MSLFRYRAIAANGDAVQGEMEAASQGAVIERLRAMGHTPVAADEVAGAGGSWLTRDLLAGGRVKANDIALLTGELATLLRAGLPLAQGLQILIEVSDKPRVAKLLRDLLARVRDGASLADAMAASGDRIPRMHVSIVRAGEAGGTLDVVLDRLAGYMEKARALREGVKSALIYPLILLVLAAATIILLVTFVVPEFQPLFEEAGQDLPLATRVVVALADLVGNYWWAILLLGLLAFLAFRLNHASAAGRMRWDALLLRLPLAGTLVTRLEVARFCRTLSALLASGVPLLSALGIVKDTLENAVMVAALDEVVSGAPEGRGLSEPLLATGVFPSMAIQLIRVGEETGALDDMLSKVADIYDEEVRRAVERMMRLLTPLLTIALGLLIAGIIGSILVAILGISQLVI